MAVPLGQYATKCVAHEQITALSTAAILTVATFKNARYALIECDHTAGKYVRWRDDGTAPTSTVGISLAPGEKLFYDGNLADIQFIEESASAKLNVSYYV